MSDQDGQEPPPRGQAIPFDGAVWVTLYGPRGREHNAVLPLEDARVLLAQLRRAIERIEGPDPDEADEDARGCETGCEARGTNMDWLCTCGARTRTVDSE